MLVSLPSSSPLVFLPCILFFLLHSPPIATNELLGQLCGNGNYAANSTYKTNLNFILLSLTSNAALSGGFNSTTIGQSPNQIHGFTLCREDVNSSLCVSCLKTASHDIVSLCPSNIEAVVWYDQCLLRYSNQLSLSQTESSKEIVVWDIDMTIDVPLFQNLVNELLSTIADWAAYNTPRMFATGEVNFTTDFPTIYGLVQCRPDMGAGRCQQCLQEILTLIPEWLGQKRGGRVLRVDCNFRFEVYKFYDGTSMRKLGSPTPVKGK
ncbi:cysteine-rich receptor-like protein kinase 10 [Cocos nucifera]|uniref:Cysteine-rich receptor-like protein kinase 10 n=1 Tax=Cocos nucifera TaxID=13894 RepID=A0A8K0MXI8_COCNU|nr:cysteine-rich receptor-like protein kinase 10 [Cocos nucifera]